MKHRCRRHSALVTALAIDDHERGSESLNRGWRTCRTGTHPVVAEDLVAGAPEAGVLVETYSVVGPSRDIRIKALAVDIVIRAEPYRRAHIFPVIAAEPLLHEEFVIRI